MRGARGAGHRQMRRAAPSLGAWRATRQVRAARTAAATRPSVRCHAPPRQHVIKALYATTRNARVSNVVNDPATGSP